MQYKTTLILLILLTASCGYHLRGAYDAPKEMKSIYLDGGSQLFREQLVNTLKSSSGKLVDSPERAGAILKIYNDNIERRVLSLSERGRSNDIELAGHLEYELLDAKQFVLIPREPINLRREYFNDQQAIIAKDNEEIVIRKEMYQQMVVTILNRSRISLANKGK